MDEEKHILFYYRKRVVKINKEFLDAYNAGNPSIKNFINAAYDKLPEQNNLVDDPNYDENAVYILKNDRSI